MAVLTWDQINTRFYETGVDRGVLYIPDATTGIYTNGYAWNGLTAVTETPTGAEPTPMYADNIKYLNLLSVEELEGTIEAMTYPDQFGQCDGTAYLTSGASTIAIGQQQRKTFGLCYRTRIGNDSVGDSFAYKLHLVYGCLASPSERAYSSVNDSPEAITFSWSFTTTPVTVTGYKNTAIVTVASNDLPSAKLTLLENALYGTVGTNPTLPLPDAVLSLISGTQTTVTATIPTMNTTAWTVGGLGTLGVVYKLASTGAVLSSNSTATWSTPISAGTSVRILIQPLDSSYVLSPATDDDLVFTRP
jgi:hypothetical protein